jgi:hypothetical protein
VSHALLVSAGFLSAGCTEEPADPTMSGPADGEDGAGEYVCPPGFTYARSHHLCENEQGVLGPFAPEMVRLCRQDGGGASCDDEYALWNPDLVRRIRGTSFCPPGTRYDLSRRVCSSDTEVFGPFTAAQIATCRAHVVAGSRSCEQRMRWSRLVLPPDPELDIASDAPYCAPPARFDADARLCVEGEVAIGPFPRAMVARCQEQGGAGCEEERWPVAQARSLRGAERCMAGSAWDPLLAVCREGAQSYGPFTRQQLEVCATHARPGPGCDRMRWHTSLLPQVGGRATGGDRRGAWLFLLSESGHTHASLAAQLASLGVGRIYIKVADGTRYDCRAFAACDGGLADLYRRQGIEAWAWSFNYPGDEAAQARSLEWAAAADFDGYVLDIESHFDGRRDALRRLMAAFHERRAGLLTSGARSRPLPLYVTTWGNPRAHDMAVEVIDAFADGHMPQVYIEHWRGRSLEDPAWAVRTAIDEYRGLGAVKPVHAIVSVETGRMNAARVNAFFGAAGPEASLWRIPGGAVPRSFWDQVWRQVDWGRSGERPEQQQSCSARCGEVVRIGGARAGTAVLSAPEGGGSEVARVHPGGLYEILDSRAGWLRIRITSALAGWIPASSAAAVAPG